MSRKPTILPPNFRRLAWSNLAAQSAEQVGLAAAPIVAVLAFGAREGAVGLLQTAQTLPFLLFSIPAGVLVDRMARSRLMAGAEALRAVSLLAILGLMVVGVLNLPLLAALGFIGACGTVVYSVAAPALVPSLVASDALPVANGRIELARAVPPMRPDRRWAARWSDGSAADRRSRLPRRCRCSPPCCSPASMRRATERPRGSIRCATCGRARHSCCGTTCCGQSSPRSSSSTSRCS